MLLLICVIQLLLAALTGGYKYKLSCDDELLFLPCKNEPEMYIWNYFDMSNMTFEFRDDGEIYMDGSLLSIAPIKPNDTLTLDIQQLKELRGQMHEVMGIFRPDLCTSLFSPSEMWYGLLSTVDEKTRTCPPSAGVRYMFNQMTTKDVTFNLPGPRMEGAYQATVRVSNPKGETIMCFVFNYHVSVLS